MPPGRVEIVARDGRSWLHERDSVPDDIDSPMGWEDLRAKFRDCCAVAGDTLSGANPAKAEEQATRLEELPDGTELIRTLA